MEKWYEQVRMEPGNNYISSRIRLAVPMSCYESFRHDFQTFDIIGHLAQSDVGAVLVSPDGLEHPVSAPGWSTTDNH